MTLLDFIILSLATYRLSRMIAIEEGPWEMFARFRTWAIAGYDEEGNPTGFWGKLLNCPWCMSVWIGSIIVLIYALNRSVGLWGAVPFALSGAAGWLYERERG